MSGATAPPGDRTFSRLLGSYTGKRDGPTLFVCGGLHGNEPSGAQAARRVIAALERHGPPLRGEFLAVAGNLGALEQDRRFLDFDLNRCWTEQNVAALLAQDPSEDGPEHREQRAILDLYEAAAKRATGPLSLLDLHTTSGESPPFVLIGDTLANRKLGFAIPGPVILGLEELVDGTLLGYVEERGHSALVVESGQHADPRAVDLHEAVIWLTLVSVGLLEATEVPHYDTWRARVAEACRGLPRVVEIRYRHGIDGDSGFAMKPGYRGLQVVQKDEVLGYDKHGEVRAPQAGRLLMPLYQDQGDDGFFIVRRVRRFWLGLSGVLRRLRLHVILRWLPGVRAHPDMSHGLLVNPRIARLFPVEIFHLFGYRRRRAEGETLVFTRRRQ